MPFVKLDCGILDSTLWYDRDMREVFITALLMALPFTLKEPTAQIEVDRIEDTGWTVPAGEYGFVSAAGTGIVRRALVDAESGISALKRLCSPEESSRSSAYDGRRLARIDGGYLVLNYQTYREKDHTTAERSRRYRERRGIGVLASRRNGVSVTRDITQAEAEAEAEKKDRARPEFCPPTAEDVAGYARKMGWTDFWVEEFLEFNERREWKIHGQPIKSWRSCAKNAYISGRSKRPISEAPTAPPYAPKILRTQADWDAAFGDQTTGEKK